MRYFSSLAQESLELLWFIVSDALIWSLSMQLLLPLEYYGMNEGLQLTHVCKNAHIWPQMQTQTQAGYACAEFIELPCSCLFINGYDVIHLALTSHLLESSSFPFNNCINQEGGIPGGHTHTSVQHCFPVISVVNMVLHHYYQVTVVQQISQLFKFI